MTHKLRRRLEPAKTVAIRVLIVDDDAHFRTYLAGLIRHLGLHVETAPDGIEAFARVRTGKFDLLLADYHMPRMNGLDLIGSIRGDASLDGLYSVMLTGDETMVVKLQALTLGYDDFLNKSGSRVEIVAKVTAARRMLAHNRALDDSAHEWRNLAYRDDLTKVSTRRFFFERAQQFLASGRPVGIVLFDLDDFKSINDTHGHLSGDRVLTCVGDFFLREIRAGDVIARFGGDEFVLLALDLTLDETRAMGDRLVEEIRALQCRANAKILQVGVTSGVGSSTRMPEATVDQLLEAADRDLYAAKWMKKKSSPSAARLLGAPRSRPEL